MTILNQLRFNAKIAMLAIAALLVPVFVQLAQAMPMPVSMKASSGQAQNAQVQDGQYVVICTTAGMVLKKVNQDTPSQQSQNNSTNESGNAGLTCPVCISFEISANACLAQPVTVPERLAICKVLTSRTLFQPLVIADFNANLSRAPPFFQTI